MQMQQWLVNNGLQVATLITLVLLIIKVSRWTGIIETQIASIQSWLKSHIENHPGAR